MKRSKSFVCLGTALLVASGSLSAPALAEVVTDPPLSTTEWISDDGGSAGRELPAISADGRYVVLVGRSSAYAGVWIKDRAQPEKKAWRLATGFLFNPDISADGKVVAWSLYGSGEGGQAVYVLEWQKPGATPEMVSLSDSGTPASGTTDYPSLSEDGRYVAFQSMDTTLDADALAGPQGGGPNKVYVRDRLAGDTQMVSVADTDAGDVIVNGNAVRPDITPDGRYVTFASDAGILQGTVEEGHDEVSATAEEEDSFQQVFVRDRQAGTTTPVSLAADGTTFGDGGSSTEYGPTISDDGMKVAFESDASNLVAGDTNGDTDAFVRNMATGKTFIVSLDEDGEPVDMVNPEAELAALAGPGGGGGGGGGEGESGPDLTPNIGAGPAISGNGEFVAFESIAALTADDLNGVGESTCTDAEGTYTEEIPIADVYRVAIGDDAVVAGSLARQSIPNDVEGAFEAWGFRIDGMTGLCTPGFNGADPAIARDGSRVAFVSAGNLVGRTVEEEDHEGEAVTDGDGIEPSTYLHREYMVPESVATGPEYVGTLTWKIGFTATDGDVDAGLDTIDLYVDRPDGTTGNYELAGSLPGAVSGEFTFDSTGVLGIYRFYTVATDMVGHVEPAPSTPDVTVDYTDITPPVSKASGPAMNRTGSWTVTYESSDPGTPALGVVKVELFVKAPGSSSYKSTMTDTTLDGKFAFAAGDEGAYAFYTVATDKAGNVEKAPAGADFTTVFDKTAPVSEASSRPLVNKSAFVVSYRHGDGDGSGVERVALFVKRPGAAAFVRAQVDVGADVDGRFRVAARAGDGVYRFYTVAADVAGNREAVPVVADTLTRVDTKAPGIRNPRVVPSPFDISDDKPALFRMRVTERSQKTFLVKRNGVVVKRMQTRFTPRGLVTRKWFGKNDAGRLVLDGRYVVVMKAKDRAGNMSVARVPLRVTR
jgi:Tol biopolymer transport system component